MMNRLIILKFVIILSCVCYSVCSLTLGKRERKVLTVDMWTEDKVYVDDVFDDVVIQMRRHVYGLRKSEIIYTELFSGALKYATQTFKFDVKAIGDNTCIKVAERWLSGTTSNHLPGFPGVGNFCGMKSFPDTTWTYNSSRPFVVQTRLPFADSLWFSLRVNMHAEDRNGNRFVSGVSRRITLTEDMLASVTVINLRDKCGDYVMLDSFDDPWKPDRKPPRPVLLYYDQGIYGDADCTVRFLTNFREFGRIELQFIEYREINGFCIDAGGTHSYNFMTSSTKT